MTKGVTKCMTNDGDFVAYDGRCAACDDLRRIAPLIGATGAVTSVRKRAS